MPVPVLYQMVEDVTERLRKLGLYKVDGDSGDRCGWKPRTDSVVNGVLGYGHVGDGNLHLNVSAKSYDPELIAAIEPYVYEWARTYRGSISAEHGLGLMKAQHIGYTKSPAMVDTMHRLKHLFDPNGIMNPYKFLPKDE